MILGLFSLLVCPALAANTPLISATSTQPTGAIATRTLAPSGSILPLNIAGGELFYKTYGKPSSPAIVLLHGLDSSHITWRTVGEALSQKFFVVTYDQRGHGASVARGEDYSTRVMAADLLALLDHLRIQKAYVVGHSMGARIAVRFAALFPTRTLSVVVEDMEMISRGGPLSPRQLARLRAEAADARALFAERTFASKEAMIEKLEQIYGTEDAEYFADIRGVPMPGGSYFLNFRPDVNILWGTQGNAENLTPALQRLRMPVLFLDADLEQGSAMSRAGFRAAKKANPKAKHVFLKGIGHDVHKTIPDRFCTVVSQFIQTKP